MTELDPANIPVFTGNLELLESYIGALRKDAARLRATGSDIHSRFQGLAAHYRAPEAKQLFATTLPVRERAHAFAAKLDKVAGALSEYAAEARPLARKLAALALEAETFMMSVEGDGRWKHDTKKTNHHNRIRDDITTAKLAFEAAERRCASKITALVGGPRFTTDDGTHQKFMYGYDAKMLEHAKLPWGDPVEREYDWYEPQSLKSFAWDGVVIDGVWGTTKGLGTLIGVDGWDRMGQAWAGLGKTAVGALMYGTGAFEIPDDYLPKFFEDSKRAARETGKALIAYDEWGKDPKRAAGALTFNVLTAATGTGAAAKAGTAAKVLDAAGKAGRFIDPVTYAGKGAGFVLNKSLNKLSTSLPKAGDLANALRDRTPGMERLPDGTVRLPDASVLPGRARYLRPDGPLVDIRGREVRGQGSVRAEPAGAELQGAGRPGAHGEGTGTPSPTSRPTPHQPSSTGAHLPPDREPVSVGAGRAHADARHTQDVNAPRSTVSSHDRPAEGTQRTGRDTDSPLSARAHQSEHGTPHSGESHGQPPRGRDSGGEGPAHPAAGHSAEHADSGHGRPGHEPAAHEGHAAHDSHHSETPHDGPGPDDLHGTHGHDGGSDGRTGDGDGSSGAAGRGREDPGHTMEDGTKYPETPDHICNSKCLGPDSDHIARLGAEEAERLHKLRHQREVHDIYTAIRESRTDTPEIAEKLGIDENVVKIAKKNLFLDRHTIELKNGKIVHDAHFTPLRSIAELWRKAANPIRILRPIDDQNLRALIAHEYVEHELMKAGLPYRTEFSYRPPGADMDPKRLGAHDYSPLDDEPLLTPEGALKHWEKYNIGIELHTRISPDLSNIDEVVNAILRSEIKHRLER
ncbi:hypothetical protein [Streptomyces huiliensis]|uniref:hypothetical protein n=1 Tax=Streptomyces huiliensis TaxID=2876027 RepID=UPI001CBB4F15|nr:hypothetical protein [Streptomyces huiliensis]MBZ4319709.1 hypothetical protein [Streptomyces huiliensis]